jgi:hypothetical protein
MRRTITLVSVLALMMSLLALPALSSTYSPPLGEPHTGPGGNCNDFIHIDDVKYDGTKLDNNPRDTFDLGDGVSIIVTEFTVTADGGTVVLCVKGGAEQPNSGTIVLLDGETYTHPQAISNIVWYLAIPLPPFEPEATLGVEKLADGEYDRTVTWDITKSVAPESHRLLVGGSADSSYEVDVTKTDSGPENYTVSGTIEISWTSDPAVDVTITSIEDLDFPDADITCPEDLPFDIASGESVTCDFTATGDPDVTENTVEVEGYYTIPEGYQDAGDDVPVDGDATSEEFTYEENLDGYDEVDVTDEFDGGAAELLGTIDDSFLFEYDRTFTCEARGTYEYPNTATIVETGQSDDALVTVECVVALEACTPGFWGGTSLTKPFTSANQPAWDYLTSGHGISPSTTLASVGLTGYNGLTFNQVFNTTGRNNYSGSLIWHAAAAYLNAQMAEDGLLDFPMTTEEVVELYLAGDKDALAFANEDGECPFGADWSALSE